MFLFLFLFFFVFFFIFKKGQIDFSMTHSRFVKAFSRISKKCVFRFHIFCHIDLVLLYFCFRWVGAGAGGAQGWRASGTLSNYNVLIQMRSFVLVIKNNEAVLVIK